MQGLLDMLGDSHTFVVAPAERRRAKAAGDSDTAAGFGLGFAPARDGIEVAEIVPGGPADRAGVAIGWRLLAIDGRPPDWTVRYDAGDRAVLSFRDDAGRRRDMPLTGEALPDTPTRRSRPVSGGALLLGFDGLDPGTDRWIAGEIATHRPGALILDLRDNDGGESTVLDRVAGLFFTERRPVLRLIRRRETVETTIGAGRDTFTGRLVLLVGPGSASAAEAFAAMIAESGRGRIVGQRTAGRLTGAAEHRLPDGGLLSIAEHDVRTPAGRRLEGSGLMPDTVVVPTLDDRRRRRDPALACAVAIAGGEPCATRPADSLDRRDTAP